VHDGLSDHAYVPCEQRRQSEISVDPDDESCACPCHRLNTPSCPPCPCTSQRHTQCAIRHWGPSIPRCTCSLFAQRSPQVHWSLMGILDTRWMWSFSPRLCQVRRLQKRGMEQEEGRRRGVASLHHVLQPDSFSYGSRGHEICGRI